MLAGASVSRFITRGASSSQPNQPPITGKMKVGSGGAVSLLRDRNSRAVNAGLKVSELNAEMIVLAEMVTANWRKKWPVIPEMKAQGTNTALSTRPMAMTGAETWRMAAIVASRGAIPFSI